MYPKKFVFECDPDKNVECNKYCCRFNSASNCPYCSITFKEEYKWDGKTEREVKDRTVEVDADKLVEAWKKEAEDMKLARAILLGDGCQSDEGNKKPHGSWMFLDTSDVFNRGAYCSSCHTKITSLVIVPSEEWKNFKYCPYCGEYKGEEPVIEILRGKHDAAK